MQVASLAVARRWPSGTSAAPVGLASRRGGRDAAARVAAPNSLLNFDFVTVDRGRACIAARAFGQTAIEGQASRLNARLRPRVVLRLDHALRSDERRVVAGADAPVLGADLRTAHAIEPLERRLDGHAA